MAMPDISCVKVRVCAAQTLKSRFKTFYNSRKFMKKNPVKKA